MKAVLWADTIQTGVMLAGIIASPGWKEPVLWVV